jgi:protein gp37
LDRVKNWHHVFIQLEPYLEEIDTAILDHHRAINWLIVGGQSVFRGGLGGCWLPVDRAWLRRLERWCYEKKVALYVKRNAVRCDGWGMPPWPRQRPWKTA